MGVDVIARLLALSKSGGGGGDIPPEVDTIINSAKAGGMGIVEEGVISYDDSLEEPVYSYVSGWVRVGDSPLTTPQEIIDADDYFGNASLYDNDDKAYPWQGDGDTDGVNYYVPYYGSTMVICILTPGTIWNGYIFPEAGLYFFYLKEGAINEVNILQYTARLEYSPPRGTRGNFNSYSWDGNWVDAEIRVGTEEHVKKVGDYCEASAFIGKRYSVVLQPGAAPATGTITRAMIYTEENEYVIEVEDHTGSTRELLVGITQDDIPGMSRGLFMTETKHYGAIEGVVCMEHATIFGGGESIIKIDPKFVVPQAIISVDPTQPLSEINYNVFYREVSNEIEAIPAPLDGLTLDDGSRWPQEIVFDATKPYEEVWSILNSTGQYDTYTVYSTKGLEITFYMDSEDWESTKISVYLTDPNTGDVLFDGDIFNRFEWNEEYLEQFGNRIPINGKSLTEWARHFAQNGGGLMVDQTKVLVRMF